MLNELIRISVISHKSKVDSHGLTTLQCVHEESKVLVRRGHYYGLLDGGVVGASRELAVDKDARGEADLAIEGLIVELIGESCCRHCWGWDATGGQLRTSTR